LSANDNTGDAGLYTWVLSTDTLYADTALAELFGIDKDLAEHGLPVQSYFDRVYADDMPRLAKAIRTAILTGRPFQETYRVFQADDSLIQIVAFGRCFSDDAGNPQHYAGIVFPMPATPEDEADLRWLCVAALERASDDGRQDVANLLVKALKKLDETGSA
jgi:PAS domain-containing protein